MPTLKTNALTTPARAASFLRIPLDSSTEALLTLLINSATSFVENYIGYNPQKTTYTNEEYNTEKGDALVLKAFPLTNDTVVIQRRNSGINEDSWGSVEEVNYHVERETGIIYGASGRTFGKTTKGFRATYTAGFDYDNVNTFLGDTDGADIEMACWLLVAGVYNTGHSGAGIQSESIGDYRVVYKKAMFENDDIESLLDAYTRLDIMAVAPRTPRQY